MSHYDDIEYLNKKLKECHDKYEQLEADYNDYRILAQTKIRQLESEIAVLNESISEYDKAVNSLEAENQRLTEAIEFEINQPMQIARQQERLQKALEGL